jgi:hypothetical protein
MCRGIGTGDAEEGLRSESLRQQEPRLGTYLTRPNVLASLLLQPDTDTVTHEHQVHHSQ